MQVRLFGESRTRVISLKIFTDERESLINWFFLEKNNLNAKVLNFEWPSWQNKPFNDVQVQIHLNGSHIGRGTAINPLDALAIAINEALERYICSINHVSTNGVAVFYDYDGAAVRASSELIERHAVFYHLINKIPFYLVDENVETTNIIQNELKIHLFKTQPFNNATTYIYRSEILINGGMVYLTSSDFGKDAEMKLLRKYFGLKENNFLTDNKIQSNCLKDIDFRFRDLFINNSNNNDSKNMLSIYYQELFVDSIDLPVRCVRALSDDALTLENTNIKHFIG